ncbi:hypothetical protein [Streptomyces niveus]|uniref:hypothetical protein n=1 Tax=Streptomyces niveus TaxID=193462 RepID=UPI003427A3F7
MTEPLPPERARLRAALVTALNNASHTHPCPVTGSAYWTGCYHPDGTGASCHSERRADAVLTVLDAEIAATEEKASTTTVPTATPEPDQDEPLTPGGIAAQEIQALHDSTVIGYLVGVDRLGLVLSPSTEAVWSEWQQRLQLDPRRTTHRGGHATGHGTWGAVPVAVTCYLDRVTPAAPEPVLTARQERLLATMRRADAADTWSTGPVEELYRTWHVRTPRHEARRDLNRLAELGHLTRHGDDTGRRYRLARKDGAR